MKPSIRKQVRRHRFDFEVGYVVKSPCRRCPEHRIFPKCLKSCKIIDDLQTMICETVS